MNLKQYLKQHLLIAGLALLAAVFPAAAQLPVITSFSQNGILVCSNLQPNGFATIEWAPTASGPWSATWSGLAAITANSNGVIQASVPMFFRVRAPAPPTNGMVLVPGGEFTIGNFLQNGANTTSDPDITDAIPTNVYVSGFYMDVNLVTYDMWTQVMNFATNFLGYQFNNSGQASGTNYPVNKLPWYDCVKWCNARSQIAGLTPVYYSDSALTQVFTNGELNNTNQPYADWAANGFRLPTEAEWEKAARGGLIGQRFPLGDVISESQANYLGDTNDYSYDLGPNGYNPLGFGGEGMSPVGSFPINGYGLADMAGNAYEWCWDFYAAPPYPAGSAYLGGTDPKGPTSGSFAVMRGGNFASTADKCRCASRLGLFSLFNTSLNGFRCVRNQ